MAFQLFSILFLQIMLQMNYFSPTPCAQRFSTFHSSFSSRMPFCNAALAVRDISSILGYRNFANLADLAFLLRTFWAQNLKLVLLILCVPPCLGPSAPTLFTSLKVLTSMSRSANFTKPSSKSQPKSCEFRFDSFGQTTGFSDSYFYTFGKLWTLLSLPFQRGIRFLYHCISIFVFWFVTGAWHLGSRAEPLDPEQWNQQI